MIATVCAEAMQKSYRLKTQLQHHRDADGTDVQVPPFPGTKKKHMLEESNDGVIVWREDGANHAMQKEPTWPTC